MFSCGIWDSTRHHNDHDDMHYKKLFAIMQYCICHKNCNFWHGFIGCKYAAIQITWLAEVYLV